MLRFCFCTPGGNGLPFVKLLSKLFNYGALLLQQNAGLVAEHFTAIKPTETGDLSVYGRSGGLAILVREIHAQCDLLAADLVHQFVHKRELRHLIAQLMSRGALELDTLWIDHQLVTSASDVTDRVASDRDLASFDQLLDEIALIVQRSESFSRFIARWDCDIHASVEAEFGDASGHAKPGVTIPITARPSPSIPRIVPNQSEYAHLVQEITGMYTVLELAYMLQSTEKSFAIEEILPYGDQGIHVSSIVGDAFCIVQKSMGRAQATGNVDSACGVANHINVVLAERLYALLMRRASSFDDDGGVAFSIQWSERNNTMLQSESAARNHAISVTLNSLQLASEYTRELQARALTTANEVLQEEEDKEKFRSCCEALGDVAFMFDQALRSAVDSFAVSLYETVQEFVDINFVDYELSEAAYGEHEAGGTFAARLLRTRAFLDHSTRGIHPSIVNSVGNLTIAQLVRQLRARIERCRFTQLGALVLDRQLRGLQQTFLDLQWPHFHLKGLRSFYTAYL